MYGEPIPTINHIIESTTFSFESLLELRCDRIRLEGDILATGAFGNYLRNLALRYDTDGLIVTSIF